MVRMSEQSREREALKSIRGSLAELGYDLISLTDDELRKKLMDVHRVSVKCGLNSDEVVRLVCATARTASKPPPSVS